jgi:hypothetical protein
VLIPTLSARIRGLCQVKTTRNGRLPVLPGSIGRCFEFLCHDKGLFDDQSLDRRETVELRRDHDSIIRAVSSMLVEFTLLLYTQLA